MNMGGDLVSIHNQLEWLNEQIIWFIEQEDIMRKQRQAVVEYGRMLLEESDITPENLPKKGAKDQDLADLVYAWWF